MRDVDQVTGRDLVPQPRGRMAMEHPPNFLTGANHEPLGGRSSVASRSVASTSSTATEERRGRGAKRLTSPERWEIKQLIASGVAKATDYPELMEEEHSTPASRLAGDDADEDIEI